MYLQGNNVLVLLTIYAGLSRYHVISQSSTFATKFPEIAKCSAFGKKFSIIGKKNHQKTYFSK